MSKTVYKLFWAWESKKEEKWLNEMSAKGLQLCGVGYCKYTFEESPPGEYLYRLEMLDHWPRHPESAQYIRFIEETEAEYIGSMLRWAYFRKKAGAGPFDLFSDLSSRIKHLNRILVLVGIVSGINLFNGVTQFITGITEGLSSSLISSGLCLCVGLWLGYGFVHLFRRRRDLQKEQTLRE